MEEAQRIVKEAVEKTVGQRGRPSQYRLAQVVGVSQATVSDWMKGKTHPNGRHLIKLMQIAGKTLAVAIIATTALLPQKSEASVSAQVYEKAGLFIHYTKYLGA